MRSALFRRSFLFGYFFLLIAAFSTVVNASTIPYQPDSPIIARIDFTGTITSLFDPSRLFGTGSEAVELFVGDPIVGGYVFTENGDEEDYGWYSLGPPERRAPDSDYFIDVDFVGEDGSAGRRGSHDTEGQGRISGRHHHRRAPRHGAEGVCRNCDGCC